MLDGIDKRKRMNSRKSASIEAINMEDIRHIWNTYNAQ